MSQEVFLIGGGVLLLLISLSIHEAAHAIVAYWCGDDTAKVLGRLTINPIKHLDLWFSIIMPVFFLAMSGGKFAFGGAKPVPVNPFKLRHPGRDMAFVAIAGPLSNVLLACLFLFLSALTLRVGYFTDNDLGNLLLQQAGLTNLFLAVFNMIPIPPLDGSRVMGYLLPKPLAEPYLKLEQFGILIVLALLMFNALDPILQGTVLPMFVRIKYFWYDALGIF